MSTAIDPKENITVTVNINTRKKLKLYLILMFFLSALIHTLLEIFKEIIIITKQTPSSIYFIKLFLTLPVSFFLAFILQRFSRRYSLSSMYKFGIVFYSLFFIIFGLVVLPNEQRLQKESFWIYDVIGEGKLEARNLKLLEPLCYIYSQIVYTIFYLVAEMWGSFMISYFFYLFANSLCTKEEMESILPNLSSISALSMIISALLYALLSAAKKYLSYKSSVTTLVVIFVTKGAIALLLNMVKNYLESNYKKVKENTTPLVNLSNSKSIGALLQSRLLQSMAIISMVYSFNTTLIEYIFKNSLSDAAKIKNVSTEEYSSKFINLAFFILSIYILAVNAFIYKWLKNVSWRFISLVSPCISLFSGTIISCMNFYNFPTATQKGLFLNEFLCKMPKFLDAENWITMVLYVLCKGNRLSLYDLAKESVSMRIPDQYRGQYKSIYDGICFKLGKSLASLYGTILTICGVTNIRQVSPISLLIFIISNYLWVKAVIYVNQKYQDSVEKNCDIEVDIVEE